MFVIHTYDKKKFVVTEDEARDVLEAKSAGDDGVFIKGGFIACANISGVYPQESEDRSSQVWGVMHDGQSAFKQFGVWVDPRGPRDEKGYYLVKYSTEYYPEAARDCVPTPEEYDRDYKNLSLEERKTKMLGGVERRTQIERGSQSLTAIGDIL